MSNLDAVNAAHISETSSVTAYAKRAGFDDAEAAVLDMLHDDIRGRPILDLGVGGGRTTAGLRAISSDYIAIDNAPEMVEACRARYPGVDVRLGDVRDLSSLPADHFGFVLFSMNGLGMLGHDDRLRALVEIRRVLAPGGAFAFSTHNLDSPANHRRFALPALELSRDPLRTAVRALRFARSTVKRAVNRVKYLRHEERHHEWAILNNECLDYGTLLYHVTLAETRRQLAAAGYTPTVKAFDLRGVEILHATTDDSILYVARR